MITNGPTNNHTRSNILERMASIKHLLVTFVLVMVAIVATTSARRFNFIQDDLDAMIKSNGLGKNDLFLKDQVVNKRHGLDHVVDNKLTNNSELTLTVLPPSNTQLTFIISEIPWAMTSPSNLTIQFNNLEVVKCDLYMLSLTAGGTATVTTKPALSLKYFPEFQLSALNSTDVDFKPALLADHDYQIKAMCTYKESIDDVIKSMRVVLINQSNGAKIISPTQILPKAIPLTTKTSVTETHSCRRGPGDAGNVLYPRMTINSLAVDIKPTDQLFFTELITPHRFGLNTCNATSAYALFGPVVATYDNRYQTNGGQGMKLTPGRIVPAGANILIDCMGGSYYDFPSARAQIWAFGLMDAEGKEIKAMSYSYTTDASSSC